MNRGDPHDAAPETPAGWPSWCLCAGMLMIILDQTIVNVALPAIQADLGFARGLAWAINAYLIAVRRPAAAARPASVT